MKKYWYCVIITVLFCFLVGCRKTPSVNTDGNTVTVAETSETPTSVPHRETTYHITWALSFNWLMVPDAEKQRKINDILYEKGFDCTIDFVQMGTLNDEENESWLQTYISEHGNPPDVVCTGYWSEQSKPAEFVKKYFLPLGDYLSTAQGRSLYEAFAPVDWEACNIDENIYTIPWIVNNRMYNRGVYLHINQKYKDYFSTFDGTYRSLHDIYQKIGDERLYYAFSEPNSVIPASFLYGAMGFQCLGAALPYDPNSRKFVDFSQENYEEIFRTTVDLIYNDLKFGILVPQDWADDKSDAEVLAYIDLGIASSLEGYSRVVMAEDTYGVLLGGSYGIARDSVNQEMALKILTACYADPELAVLLCPNMGTAAEWTERKELMKEEHGSDLTGFVIKLTGTNKKAYDLFGNTISGLNNQAGMLVFDSITGKCSLKKSFRYETWGGRQIFNQEDVRAMIVEINHQLTEYME